MNDERDLKTRQAAHEDHSVWLSQHAAWASEAEGWLKRLEDHVKTLDQLRGRLDRERARVETHIEGIRRHEGAITNHEVLLAELDSGTCGGCEEAEPSAHATAAAKHGRETTVHTRMADRQDQIASRLSLLAEILEQTD